MNLIEKIEENSNWVLPVLLKCVDIYVVGRRRKLRNRLEADGWNFPKGFEFIRDRHQFWE